jgi:hypothetical protein
MLPRSNGVYRRRARSGRDRSNRSAARAAGFHLATSALPSTEFEAGESLGVEFLFVDQQKIEAVRVRLVTLLGRATTARVAADVSAVEYQLEGLWADRLDRQRIRIPRERFERHRRPDQVFPPEALFYATSGRSFLLTTEGGIVPHAN